MILMDTKGRLVAGSHNRNEFILINADETARVSGFLVFIIPLLLLFNTASEEIATS